MCKSVFLHINMRIALLLTSFIFSVAFCFGQQGTIRGTVTDEDTGEALIGVNIGVTGTTTGQYTDLDGQFSINIEPGTYELRLSYISYDTKLITDVVVKSGEVNLLNNIQMNASGAVDLKEFIVKAEVVKNNEMAMMVMKKNSVTMIDGISSERMGLIGDGNAAEAAKRVTGISIEGGKYIYVRGLGDRYSKTTLNGLDIPGLDPDRNTLQLDIFPSNLINNISVSKNFMADMPADFTGGLVNIETKDFPDSRSISFNTSLGYNSGMHFNSDFLSSEGSSTDFLGFDDGLRDVPLGAQAVSIPTPVNGAPPSSVNSFIRRFNPTLAAVRENSLMDFSFGASYGNQIDLAKNKPEQSRKLGIIASLSYKTEYTYYDDVVYGEYQRLSNPDSLALREANLQTGEVGEKNVLLGAIAGIAYKTELSKYRLTAMRLQSGTSRAAKFDIVNNGEAVGQSGFIAVSDNLEYNERAMTNVFLGGNHILKNQKWEVDWRVAPTLSISEDPDIRKTAFTVTPNFIIFSAGAGGNPSRIWRSLDEVNIASRGDITMNYSFKKNQNGKLKFGASHTYKNRNYEILFFDVQFFGNQEWESTDASQVLLPENIFPNQPNSIYYQSGNNSPNPNEFNSDITNNGFYVSNELALSKRLNTVIGLRAERYVQHHTGRDQAFASGDLINGKNLVDEEVLNTFNILPSVNLIFARTENQNLRFSYARTVARPSFKEMSFAQIIDPITNRIFNGGLFVYTDSDGNVTWDGQLQETDIDNLDIRWEWFQDVGQMYSISAFYKRFQNPIELIRIPEQQTSAEFQPRNVGDGTVYGVELELRKNLSFISEKYANFGVNANVTLAESAINMTDLEFGARSNFERSGETIKNERQMAGQSPYVLNAGLTYTSADKNSNLGFFYNVKGPTLEVVGTGLYPDVYTQPFNSLNFSLNRKLGAKGSTSLDFKAANILGSKVESYYVSEGATDQIFSSFSPGTIISLGFGHTF